MSTVHDYRHSGESRNPEGPSNRGPCRNSLPCRSSDSYAQNPIVHHRSKRFLRGQWA